MNTKVKNVKTIFFNINSNLKIRLPPEVKRVIFVRNLPYKITPDELYDIFGKFGAIRQIRRYFIFLILYI